MNTKKVTFSAMCIVVNIVFGMFVICWDCFVRFSLIKIDRI